MPLLRALLHRAREPSYPDVSAATSLASPKSWGQVWGQANAERPSPARRLPLLPDLRAQVARIPLGREPSAVTVVVPEVTIRNGSGLLNAPAVPARIGLLCRLPQV
jgi:hypothetical protein